MARTNRRDDPAVRLRPVAESFARGVAAEMAGRPWQTAFIDMRWTEKAGTTISKLRVVLPGGVVTALLDTPLENVPAEAKDILRDAWQSQATETGQRWYGVRLTVKPDGDCEVKFDYDSQCVVDPTFFDD